MKTCAEIETLLTPYVDGEAAAHDRTVVDVHVALCSPCRERLQRERDGRELLRSRRHTLAAQAPEWLRARCAGSLRRAGPHPVEAAHPEGPAAAGPSRRWVPLSIAATLVLAVAGALLSRPPVALAAQLTADHIKCFKLFPSRNDGDARTFEERWQQREGWAIRIPASWSTGELELLGVRKCLSTDGVVAHVMYTCRGEPLSVYVIRRSERASGVLDVLGHKAVIWSSGGRTYAVLGREQIGRAHV